MDVASIIGFSASVLAVVSAVPQAYKTWKTKSADDLSYLTLSFLALELFLWLIYGFYIAAIPIIFSNLFGLISLLAIIIMKYIYEK